MDVCAACEFWVQGNTMGSALLGIFRSRLLYILQGPV